MIRLVLGAGTVALLLGLVGGAALQTFLFKVNAHDPCIDSAVAALLAAVGPPRHARESDGSTADRVIEQLKVG